MLRSVYIFCILIVFGNVFLSCRQDGIVFPRLNLILELDSTVLLEGQDLFTDVTLKNVGCDTANLVPFLLRVEREGILYTLRDERGNKIRLPDLNETEGSTASNLIIPPGDSVSEMHDLSDFFSNSEDSNCHSYIQILNCLRPGNYSIQAYTIPVIDTIWSNSVEFKIVKPIGEDLEALNNLREIERSQTSSFGDSTDIYKYENFISNFSQSIYIPQVYERLIYLLNYSQLSNKEETEKIVYKLIDKYPNNYNSIKYFRYLFYNSTANEKNEIITNILQKYPGTAIKKYCKQLLKQNIKKDKK